MKRKQGTLQGFFHQPSNKKAITTSGQDDAALMIDLTQSDTPDIPQPVKPVPAASSTAHLPNAFSKLLAGSKAVSKKNRALFTLDVLPDHQILPNFTFDYDHQHLSLEGCWHCEVNIAHFRWSIDEKVHKDVVLTLRTNILPPTFNPSTINASPSKANSSSKATINSSSAHATTQQSTSKSVINTSLLKSMIQKGVRRRQCAKVLRLSHELCKHNLQEFIRRLTVISVEDALLHPGIPIVVWLMIATSKGYEVSAYLQDVCLSVIGDLCRSEVRDSYVPSSFDDYDQIKAYNHISNNSTTTSSPGNKGEDRNEILDLLLNAASRTLIASLLLRRAYGGMGGDMDMLEGYAILWAKRLSCYDPISAMTSVAECPQRLQLPLDACADKKLNIVGRYLHRDYVRQLMASGWTVENAGHTLIEGGSNIIEDMLREQGASPTSIATLTADDLISEGLDFHCDWSMIDHIMTVNHAELDQYFAADAHVEYRQGMIKKAIWEFRSSTNHHKLWTCYRIEKQEYDVQLLTSLQEKQQMTKLWKIICPTITAYCHSKMAVIARQFRHY